MRRPFEPTYPLGAAGRNANAIEIATSHAVLRLGQPAAAGSHIELKCRSWFAGGHQRCPAPQCCCRRKHGLHSPERTPINHAPHAAHGPFTLRKIVNSCTAAAAAGPSRVFKLEGLAPLLPPGFSI